jgi:regulator of cell morphogenesis and NO signaling
MASPNGNPIPMTRQDVTTAALIADVQARFHDKHRIDLPLIVDLARAYEWRGGRPGLADRFAVLAVAMEEHMREEEARLFPLMAKGGSPLVRHLIDHLREEHAAQRTQATCIADLLAAERADPAAEAQLSALRAAARRFFEELAEHARIEEEQLFARFA